LRFYRAVARPEGARPPGQPGLQRRALYARPGNDRSRTPARRRTLRAGRPSAKKMNHRGTETRRKTGGKTEIRLACLLRVLCRFSSLAFLRDSSVSPCLCGSNGFLEGEDFGDGTHAAPAA